LISYTDAEMTYTVNSPTLSTISSTDLAEGVVLVSVVGNLMAGWLSKKQVFLLGYLDEAGKSITGVF
jgi:hypothetical protein